MSDAAENVEIEDVLASIRRLVSDEVTRELRGGDDAQPARDGAGDAGDRASSDAAVSASDAQSDALVLSASFRVPEAAEELRETQQPGAADDHAEGDAADDAASHLDDEVPVSDEAMQVEPDGVDETAPATPDAVLSAVADQIANWDPSLDEAVDAEGMQDADSDARDTAEDNPPGAELNEALTDSDAAPLNLAEIGAQIHPDRDEADETADGDGMVHSAETEEDGLESKIARLERLIGTQDNGWEPESEDAPQPDLAAPLAETIEWQDADADPDDAQDELTVTPAISTPVVGGGDTEGEAVLDEEALRGMVAAIVREELQGALGERITRNVRKLVRREIHRALASQELD